MTLTGGQLTSQLQAVLEKYPQARLVGFACDSGFQGADSVQAGGTRFRVCLTNSPLQVHLWAAEDEPTLFLWQGDERQLSQDILQRLPGGRLRHPDVWEAVRQLFRAQAVDARLRRSGAVATFLVESEPVGGYAAAPGGVLTAEFAWEQLLKQRLGLHPDSHDPRQLLRWLVSRERAQERLLGAPAELLRLCREWLVARGGGLLDFLFPQLLAPFSYELVSLGVVCDVLYPKSTHATPAPEALVARTRLERLLEDRALPPALARQWAEVTVDLFEPTGLARASWVDPALQRAGAILKELGAETLVGESALLPQAFEAGLGLLADNLKSGSLEPAARILERLRAHLDADRRSLEVEQAEMAVRLARYLQAPEPSIHPELTSQAQDYVERLSFVDWARSRLAGSTTHPGLQAAYSRLLTEVLGRRESSNQSFADALRSWHEGGASNRELLVGEEFLPVVLAPLLKHHRVLLVVLDGCGLSSLRELFPSLEEAGWSPYRPREARWQRLLAGLPSVTEVSRTTLLSGEVQQGNQKTEKSAFPQHPALSGFNPRLYHKGDLGKSAVTDAILDVHNPLVGLVVNSIDDTLAKDEQLELSWTRELIRPLHQALQNARLSDRVVLLVSDHGHILEAGTVQRPSVSGGSRYQLGDKAETGEVVLSGGRVRLGKNVRMLWTETARHGPRKRGYHGGATPQEMLCSLCLFAPSGTAVDGWNEGQTPAPSWWEPAQAPSQDFLFAEASSADVWTRLEKHPALALKKAPVNLKAVVVALAAAGGRAPLAQLARGLGLTESSLRKELPVWLRLLKAGETPLLTVNASGSILELDLRGTQG